MNRLVLGIGAAAVLMTSAAFAGDPQNTQVAAIDNSPAAFSKLDMDKDGRVSAIEAANDSKLAAAFTQADTDRDGYLSMAEFNGINGGTSSTSPSTMPTEPDDSSTTTPPSDTTPPPQ